jgi:hypothetical protein
MVPEARTVSQAIAAPAAELYAYVSNPANLPEWAAGLAEHPVEQVDGHWYTDAPFGRVEIVFADPNPFGVLDHEVIVVASGERFTNPMRVVRLGDGCEVTFSVRRLAGMPDADFERDVAAVAADLETLRARFER